MNDNDKNIAARARAAMEKNGVQNVELAKRVGKSSATVSDYLSGTIRIPVSVLVEISNLTGESIEFLAAGKIYAPPPFDLKSPCMVSEHAENWKITGDPPKDFEQRIISMLRRLPPDQRQAFIDLITTAYVDHMENQ